VLGHAVKQGNEVDLGLTGQGVHVSLPSSTSQAVQPLRDNPDVQIAQPLGPPKTPWRVGDLTWNITLGLIDTEIEGTGLRLVFSSSPDGPPRILLGPKPEMTGELTLQEGKFDFLGVGSGFKLFQLDRGIVRFRSEEPSNPYVNLTAHYDAADGSTITCEYVGVLTPVTRDKLHFSSSPPRTQEEIISLLLFGETGTGASSAGRSPTAGGYAGASSAAPGGGNIAAYQLNALLGGIAPLRGLSTSFGTTEEGFTSTGVAYQVTDTVTAEAAYERRGASSGTPGEIIDPMSTGQQSSAASRTRIGVDWRFYRDFLLRGSIGIGDEPSSGLDLMWQYRY
jgi:translocation and assembly module TamB